jgi:hypothetical protein
MEEFRLACGVLMIWIIGSCTPYYLSSRFESITADHRRIAILPFEMRFTGLKPEKLTDEDVLELEEAESRAFQISFYHEILRSTKSGRKAIRVDLQDYQKTLDLLDGHNISIRDSWAIAPDELAKILDVDAVVRARIEKARYMSDLASYGIEVGVEIVHYLTNIPIWLWVPGISNQSKAIVADYTLYNEKDDLTLWSIAFDEGADWRRPAHEIIDEISRKAARKFPYRF